MGDTQRIPVIEGRVYGYIPQKGIDYFTDADKAEMASSVLATNRVASLNDTVLASATVIEAVGDPVYISTEDLADYADYGLTDTGWYAFARITAKPDTTVSNPTVTGAAGYIVGDTYVDVAVQFETASTSQLVTVNWGSESESFVFKATDLAVRNLDYRVTFYVYDIAPYATWEYSPATDATITAGKYYWKKVGGEYVAVEADTGTAIAPYYQDKYTLTADSTFADGKTYYTESNGVYTEAPVTVGEAVTADTYYEHSYEITTDEAFQEGKAYYTKVENDYTEATVTVGEATNTYYVHSKVTFAGMARNVTYRCNTIIDCPVVFELPEIEDETHGCWFEIRFQHAGSYSSTLIVPEGVKVATEHTQPETAGINTVDLHYTALQGGIKIWRFLNTHSSIPA